jgi:hypothetical protein
MLGYGADDLELSALASSLAAMALAMPLSVAEQPGPTQLHRQLFMIALDNLGITNSAFGRSMFCT